MEGFDELRGGHLRQIYDNGFPKKTLPLDGERTNTGKNKGAYKGQQMYKSDHFYAVFQRKIFGPFETAKAASIASAAVTAFLMNDSNTDRAAQLLQGNQ